MNCNIKLQFDSSVDQIVAVNDSFSTGKMRICYTGKNRNGSSISRAVIEKAKPTMFNCPVVCNYNVEEDTIGGHDVKVVERDGDLKIVNLTNAIGFIPAEADTWWENVTEENGDVNEYFNADILLWKRSGAYDKIEKDGITSQSMEIAVNEGELRDGTFYINDFTFTAFCLLGDGISPCFESASLQVPGGDSVDQQFALMMKDFKEMCSATTGDTNCDVVLHYNMTEGGGEELEEKNKEKDFAEGTQNVETEVETNQAEETTEDFDLTRNVCTEMENAFVEAFANSSWRDECYFYDYDPDVSEVYVLNWYSGIPYGFKYSMNGDKAEIDFDSKTRMKFAFVPFNEGETIDETDLSYSLNSVFSDIKNKYETEIANIKASCEEYEKNVADLNSTIASLTADLDELSKFKADIENSEEQKKIEDVFSRFEDLVSLDEFKNLRENCHDYSPDELEEKCYAIRGKNVAVNAKFSSEGKPHKLIVEKNTNDDKQEPYGGIFAEFGIK